MNTPNHIDILGRNFTASLKILNRKTQRENGQKKKRVQNIKIINNSHIITSEVLKVRVSHVHKLPN